MKSGSEDKGMFIPIGVRSCSWAFKGYVWACGRGGGVWAARGWRDGIHLRCWRSPMTSPSHGRSEADAHSRYCAHVRIPYHRSRPRTSHPAPRTASAPQSNAGSTSLPTRYSGFGSDSPDAELGSRGAGRVQRVLLSPPPLLPSTVLDSFCMEFFVLSHR
jgi:hypothetical protein